MALAPIGLDNQVPETVLVDFNLNVHMRVRISGLFLVELHKSALEYANASLLLLYQCGED